MLAGLLSQVLISGAGAYSRNRAEEVKKEWGLLSLSVIGGMIALIFLTSALYMAVSALYSPPIGALATGCVMAAFSLVCLYLANRTEKKLKKQVWPSVNDNQMMETVQSVLAEIEQPIKDNPATAVLLASIAGFLAADKIRG